MAEGGRRDGGTGPDAFGAATRLYVLLKHRAHQSIDLNWAIKNRDYAREVLRLARGVDDAEVAAAADRFEDALFGMITSPKPNAVEAPAEPDPAPPARNKYIGALR